jgi:hypothetical protein
VFLEIEMEPFHDLNLAVRWNFALIKILRTVKQRPPVLARYIYYLNFAMYEAYSLCSDYKSFILHLDHKGKNKKCSDCMNCMGCVRRIISVAAARYLAITFKDHSFEALLSDKITLEDILNVDFKVIKTKKDLSLLEKGVLAAELVMKEASKDGSNEQKDFADVENDLFPLYVGKNPPGTDIKDIDPNYWSPLQLPDGTFQKFLTPHWGAVKGFSINADNVEDTKVKPFPEAETEEYCEQVQEIVKVTAKLTEEQKVKAEFWHIGFPSLSCSPPEQWILLSFGLIKK